MIKLIRKKYGTCTFHESLLAAVINNDHLFLEQLIKYKPKQQYLTGFDISHLVQTKSQILPFNNLSLLHVAAFYDSLESFVTIQKLTKMSVFIQTDQSLQPIHYACYSHSIEIATYILTLFPDVIDQCQQYEYSLFYYAAASNNASSDQIIRLLKSHKATFESTLSKNYNPIYKAIEHNNYTVLKSLLNIHPTTNNHTKDTFSTPLITAISYNLIDVVHLLLQNGEDPTFVTTDGKCALSQACYTNYKTKENIDSNYEIIVALFEAIGNNEIEPPNLETNGPIHWICQSKSPQIAKLFFEIHPEINVNRVDEFSVSGPLLLAQSDMPDSDILEMLKIFFNHGLDLNMHSVENGQKTILEGFCFSIVVRPEIVAFLLEKGADPFLPFIGNSKNARNGTIFDKAIKKPALQHIMTDYQMKLTTVIEI